MLLGATGVGGTPASARRRGGVSPRGPPLSPWSRRAPPRPNTVNVDSSHHLTGIQSNICHISLTGRSRNDHRNVVYGKHADAQTLFMEMSNCCHIPLDFPL